MTSNSPSTLSSNAASSKRLELDNLIRRELRVGDPSDPRQIAEALMKRYGDTPTGRSLVNEARGMPFLQQITVAPVVTTKTTATDLDWEQAQADVEADLRELATHNQLKDIQPELVGWARAIRSAMQTACQAAPMALDTHQRDKTFALRRQLGEYARAARLVGTLNPQARGEFRSLAQSLDEAAAVLLVMMGEGIAGSGIAGGRYLLQVPFTELQTRREAVLYALRNLNGAAQESYTVNDWPRGLDAYRQLSNFLEQQGHGELRSLLIENELARVMDELIERAGQGVEGLRALGATAQIDLQRLMRLIAMIKWAATNPESPALLALHEALQLLMDGFKPSGGLRLVHIARPAILTYGLYGRRDASDVKVDRRMSEIVASRNQLASLLDCASECNCSERDGIRQALLDKVLFDLDRAIDLYANCDLSESSISDQHQLSAPEGRAAAYAYLFDAILARVAMQPGPAPVNPVLTQIRNQIAEAATYLRPEDDSNQTTYWWSLTHTEFEQLRTEADDHRLAELMLRELVLQRLQEEHLMSVARQMTAGCQAIGSLQSELTDSLKSAEAQVKANAGGIWIDEQLDPNLPSHPDTSADGRSYLRFRDGRMPYRDLNALIRALNK